jgi:hypothetical protein
MLGCRYIYLGLFDSEVEAARLMILDSAIDEKINFFTFLIFLGLSTDSILFFFFSFFLISNFRAYDKAAIKCNGREAVTNFEASTYDAELLTEVSAEGIILGKINDFFHDLQIKISDVIVCGLN